MGISNDIITVRYSGTGSTYIARCQGKTASCTASAKRAAEAVAKKVRNRPCDVARIDGDKLWKIVEDAET